MESVGKEHFDADSGGVDALRGFADAVPLPVASVDADERYCVVNGAYARLVGREASDIRGRTLRTSAAR